MDKIRIGQNYKNYERVQKTFKEFIKALVYECVEADDYVENLDVINDNIDNYCKANDKEMIALANDRLTKFFKSLDCRYEVHCYELNENGDVIEETAKHFNTDYDVIAFKKAAEFYRHAKCPQVNIYDNEECKYVAEWD